jgi:hypothetical protein
MTTKRNGYNGVVFSIIFKKGLAETNRLPLNHVIETLQEIDRMIRDVGREIQRNAGVENPDGDFGIELLAGRAGLAFRKGSVATNAMPTRNIEYGIEAIAALIQTTDTIEREKSPSFSEYGERILHRFPKITAIQEQDHTELHLALIQDHHPVAKTKLSKKGIETLRGMQTPELDVEGITLFGRLRQLRDSGKNEDNTEFFWGELLDDAGRVWRIKFQDSDQDRVQKLFRKQVYIIGDVRYFRTKTPRVEARDFDADPLPDYTAVFDELSEAYTDVFKDKKAEDVLKDIRK